MPYRKLKSRSPDSPFYSLKNEFETALEGKCTAALLGTRKKPHHTTTQRSACNRNVIYLVRVRDQSSKFVQIAIRNHYLKPLFCVSRQ